MDLRSNNSAQPVSDRMAELERTCFVIMPFGKKDVGGRQVDFNAIYSDLFEPAIRNVKTPEGKDLIPARTDMDAFASSINQEMFEYIMYSRMAFADISGFNPNVFYEIGARHSAQESGTVVFRQAGHEIPFDIRTIKIFEYHHEPPAQIEDSRTLITHVLSQSLRRNRLDSPVRLALRAQWVAPLAPDTAPSEASSAGAESADIPDGEPRSVAATEPSLASPQMQQEQWSKQLVQQMMRDGEEATRLGDLEMARINYWSALRFDPLNIIARMRLGLTLKSQGKHYEALGEFTMITKLAPNYGEAWREKGVVEGLIVRKIPTNDRPKWLPDGYDALKRATLLIPDDFDTWASLGGILKNVRQDLIQAHQMYAHSAKLSDGHPYPLLNALKLEALTTGKLDLEAVSEQLNKAEDIRRAQTLATPPIDTPWCYFDLAEIQLYRSRRDDFLVLLHQGIRACNAAWQVETFRDSLKDTLVAKGIMLDAFGKAIEHDALSKGIESLGEALRTRNWS